MSSELFGAVFLFFSLIFTMLYCADNYDADKKKYNIEKVKYHLKR